ncbi:MAG: cyclase family protein [Thermodesulfobacteriota bacterium]
MTPPLQKVFDISVVLGLHAAAYPGDTPYSRDLTSSMAAGSSCDVSTITMCAHSGTHIDSPAHFIAGGKTIDEYPVTDFIRPALVVSVEGRESILPQDLEGLSIDAGDALLFRTDNSVLGLPRNPVFSERYVSLSPAAAQRCVAMGVGLVGIDCVSVDGFGDESYPVHHILLGNGILVLEGIDLNHVPPGRYTLCCLPLMLAQCEASPVRAILWHSAPR